MPEEEHPSSSLRPSSFIRKLKAKQHPPASFDNQPSRRSHARSSSFNEFVSRILPSRREERGYTLRSQYQDDGDQIATDLVFGLPVTPNFENPMLPATSDSGSSRTTRCSSHRQHEAVHTGPAQPVELRAGMWKLNISEAGSAEGNGKKPGRVVRIDPELKRGEGTHLHDHCNPSQDGRQQRPIEMPSSQIVELPRDADIEASKAQRMFEDKKASREQRRSLRESDDFLGVQGANPRTGYWDASTGTSSSEPSQMSEETKRKLDQQAREIEVQKRNWEDAQMRLQAELKRVQTVRDRKKKEKVEQKKQDVRARQKKHGKWRPSENGWRMVAEPELSPIVQSLAGSPVRETSPSDRLFPMPTAINPTPYVDLNSVAQQDYFGHHHISPSRATTPSKPGSLLSPPPNSVIQRKPVGSPPSRFPSPNMMIQNKSPATSLQDNRKSSRPSRTNALFTDRDGSSRLTPLGPLSNPPQLSTFLGRRVVPLEGDQAIKEAIATSYQSASTTQVVNRRRLAQNHRTSSPGKDVTALNDFPPVLIKDPITARIPPNYPPNPLSIWAPPTIQDRKIGNPMSSTPTFTTITTGYAHPQHRPAQLDGPIEIIDFSQLGRPSPRDGVCAIPLPTSSHQSRGQNDTPRSMSRVHPAATATSSGHQLTPTKVRTGRLCRMTSLGTERMELKTTPTFISMSPQTPGETKRVAQNAALTAFQNSKHKAAIKKAERQSGENLSPPKLRNPNPVSKKAVGQAFVVVPRGLGDIGDPFGSRQDLERHLKQHPGSHAVAAKVEGEKGKERDGFVVWHPPPDSEKKGSEGKHLLQVHRNKDLTPVRVCHPPAVTPPRHSRGEVAEIVNVGQQGGKWAAPPLAKTTPKPGISQPSVRKVMIRILGTIWWFVEPVFEPDSELRRRWEQRRLTWPDIGLFVAATIITSGILLIIAVLARIVATTFLAVKGVLGVLTGL